MEVRDVLKHREELETNILGLVRQFEAVTKVTPADLRLLTIDTRETGQQDYKSYITGIAVELKL